MSETCIAPTIAERDTDTKSKTTLDPVCIELSRVLPAEPAKVWECLSKTDWLNRVLDLPAVQFETKPREEGGSWVIGNSSMPFGALRWQELPFQWVEPEFYSVRRVFETGPFFESRLGVKFEALPDGKTRVISHAALYPKKSSAKVLAKMLVGPKLTSAMTQVLNDLEKYLKGENRLMFPTLPTQKVDEAALKRGMEQLQTTQPVFLTGRLEAILRSAPDVEVTHIRPLSIARKWEEDPWKVVHLFLQATNCGLLDFRWEVLCPNCRSTRDTKNTTLIRLKKKSHCDVCQIEFNAEFDKSVELKFAINKNIRACEEQTFCLAGPGGKPHIVAQYWLEPGEEREFPRIFATQTLRLQSPQVKTTLDLPVGEKQGNITCHATGFTAEPASTLPSRIINPNSFPISVSWHETEWSGDILTASRATSWQDFREMFAHEVISPDEQVTVGSQIILFTDLRGSTALYHGIGDASAYALVRDHFTILIDAIREHHGSVVKTIGDAVMASFSRVDEALLAVADAYRNFEMINLKADQPLLLKTSLHIGPCLAVNANDRLDYFGTTVNLAARMVECSKGGELCVSDEFFFRPETVRFIKESSRITDSMTIQHRGFSKPHRVWKIKMDHGSA